MSSVKLFQKTSQPKRGRKDALTPNQLKFIAVYIKTRNGQEAIRQAYPNLHCGPEYYRQLMKNPKVKAKIDEFRAQILAEADPSYIVQEYKHDIENFRDPVDVIRAGHHIKALNGLANYTKDTNQITQVNVGINLQIP